jgi:hypothetical protein
MKHAVPLSMLKAMAVGAMSLRKPKPRRGYNRCVRCKNPCRTALCFKCEQAMAAERSPAPSP